MAEPCLEGPRIVPGVRQGEAARVPQHVRVDWKRHASALAEAGDQRANSLVELCGGPRPRIYLPERSTMSRTCVAAQRPPRAVGMPRASSCAAIPLYECTPAARISANTGASARARVEVAGLSGLPGGHSLGQCVRHNCFPIDLCKVPDRFGLGSASVDLKRVPGGLGGPMRVWMTWLAWAGVIGLLLFNYYLRVPPGRFEDVDFSSLQSITRELFPFVLALCLSGGFVIALIAVPYSIGRRHGRSGAPPRGDAAVTAFVVFCTLGLWTLYGIFWLWLFHSNASEDLHASSPALVSDIQPLRPFMPGDGPINPSRSRDCQASCT
jgi:hypothetical protein